MAELPSRAEIRGTARELLVRALEARTQGETAREPGSRRELVNEAKVLAAKEKGVLLVPRGALVTPLARDAAEREGVELRESDAPAAPATEAAPEASPRERGGAVALGSDHGGFALKEAIKKHLVASGFAVLDQGTTSDASCDYPDFAAKVARAVSLGEARWGVFVDGAGIGGAMTSNRVPGVLAATCHDAKAATNARGHNSANVLCLGAGWVDESRAREVVS